jgi:hypothetical protein
MLEVWAHHGKGAARLPGGSINRVVQMSEQAEADIYMMGHDHKRSATPGVRLVRTHTKMGATVSHRSQFFLRTGSFYKGYEDGVSNYAVDANMNPNQLGVVKLLITPHRPGRYRKHQRVTLDMEAIV